MPLQYVSDNNGSTIAVQIPIEDWKILKERYENLYEVPQWHKTIIEERLKNYELHPSDVTNLDDYLKELNQKENEKL